MPTSYTEGRHAGEFITSEALGDRSRDAVTVLSGSGVCAAGLVMGAVTVGAATAAAKSGGNTGNGTVTGPGAANAITIATGAQNGVYTLRAIGGAFGGAIAAVAGNTGNGTAAMHTTQTAAGVVAGVYKAVFVEPAANGGLFVVENPDGVVIGDGVVGTLFDGVVKFTISDGATDFAVGDIFEITVTATIPTNGGTFRLTAPNGTVVSSAITVGAAYTGGHLNLTVNDGSTDFVVGDGFDITVAVGSGKFRPWDPANIDGSAVVAGILYDGVDATSADRKVTAITRDAEVTSAELQWKAGLDANTQASGRAQLRTLGIIAR
jgi:hypothetical protein